MENIPKFRQHCFRISLKVTDVSRIPVNIYKKIPHAFKFFSNIPVSLKALPGPQNTPNCPDLKDWMTFAFSIVFPEHYSGLQMPTTVF